MNTRPGVWERWWRAREVAPEWRSGPGGDNFLLFIFTFVAAYGITLLIAQAFNWSIDETLYVVILAIPLWVVFYGALSDMRIFRFFVRRHVLKRRMRELGPAKITLCPGCRGWGELRRTRTGMVNTLTPMGPRLQPGTLGSFFRCEDCSGNGFVASTPDGGTRRIRLPFFHQTLRTEEQKQEGANVEEPALQSRQNKVSNARPRRFKIVAGGVILVAVVIGGIFFHFILA